MYIVVLALGFIAVAAGVVGVGFGFSIKEFSFGATLLISGTTAFVGGLLTIAMAAAIRELRKVAETLASRQAVRLARPGEPVDPYAVGGFRPGMKAPHMSAMPPAPMSHGDPVVAARDYRLRESQVEAAASVEPVPEIVEPGSPSLQPLAQTVAAPPAEVAEPTAIPLSPHETSRAPTFETPGEEPGPSVESEADAPSAAQHHAADDAVAGEPAAPGPSAERVRPTPFDAIWPPLARDPARPHGDAEADEAPPPHDSEPTDAVESAAPSAASPIEPDTSSQPEEAVAEPRVADTGATDLDAPYAVSILKSGVVDGMAYTLYSDGSIEAELPSGTIRFESIDALRMHLEKTG